MRKFLLGLACALGVLTMQAETFVKVSDAATLQDGDQVILACESQNTVNGALSGKFISKVDATIAAGQVSVDNPNLITLEKKSSNWYLKLGGKYIGNTSGSNDLTSKTTSFCEFAISIAEGNAQITSQVAGKSSAEVFFRYNASSPRFALYGSSFTAGVQVQIYKLDESTIPDVVVTSVTLSKNSLDLRMGTTETLTATVLPNDAVDKTIAWGTTDASIATVANGVVTPVAVGTAKIWVKATAVENVSDTCEVTVLSAEATGNATYNAVQKADYLPAGAKVFIGTIKDGENYVMGQYVSGNNIKGTAATYDANHHSVTAPLQVAYTVQRDGDYYIFVDHDGKYLRTLSSSKLGNGTTLDDYAKWTLGAFNEDDATVVLTNKANSTKGIYNNWQGTNDMFNIYEGVGDGSYLAKTVIYSDKAPAWVERVKDPWMRVDTTYLDWGKQEPDDYTNDWGDTRYLNITMNDLPAPIYVELTNDANGAFNCWTGTISASKTSEKLLIEWTATQVGAYNGKLTLTCAGLPTIVVNLHAEAIAKGQGGENPGEEDKPELIVSANHIYLNPTTGAETSSSDNFMSAEYTFTFSAKNLAKDLRMKWWRDTYNGTWFPWTTETMQMWMAYEPMNYIYEELALNDNINLGTNDITDFEIYIYLSGIQNAGTYYSELQFTSLKAGSKTEYAINKVIPITVVVSELPTPDPTNVESVQTSEVSVQKILRDGQVLIIRNGETYSIDGKRL